MAHERTTVVEGSAMNLIEPSAVMLRNWLDELEEEPPSPGDVTAKQLQGK
jgi:hypothetical protein